MYLALGVSGKVQVSERAVESYGKVKYSARSQCVFRKFLEYAIPGKRSGGTELQVLSLQPPFPGVALTTHPSSETAPRYAPGAGGRC